MTRLAQGEELYKCIDYLKRLPPGTKVLTKDLADKVGSRYNLVQRLSRGIRRGLICRDVIDHHKHLWYLPDSAFGLTYRATAAEHERASSPRKEFLQVEALEGNAWAAARDRFTKLPFARTKLRDLLTDCGNIESGDPHAALAEMMCVARELYTLKDQPYGRTSTELVIADQVRSVMNAIAKARANLEDALIMVRASSK